MRLRATVLLYAACAAAVACLMPGCEVGPDYHTPDVPFPQAYAATAPATAPATQPAAPDLTRWWETFHDPALDQLIREAVAANLDVRLAEARIRQARAELDFARGYLLPSVDVNALFSRSRSSQSLAFFVPGTTNLFQAGFDAGWELDVFGGARRNIESASATLQAQGESRRDALVTLLGETAQNYIMLRGYQHERDIIQGNIQTQSDTVSFQKHRQQAGVAAELPIAQAQAQLESTRAQLPAVETALQGTLHRLSVLLNRSVPDLQKELAAAAPIPVGPPDVPPGLPSELLRRRPDIRQAERTLAAATADIGVATADLYPQFSLVGDVGLSSDKLKTLANSPSAFWSAGPTVTWNIFNGAQVRANIHIKNALQEQAAIQYQQTIIRAVAEVEDALVAYRQDQLRRDSWRASTAANRRALDLARRQNDAGVVDFLNVLNAQQSLYTSEDQLAQSEQSVSTSLVALYKALGGGWEPFDPASASAPTTSTAPATRPTPSPAVAAAATAPHP